MSVSHQLSTNLIIFFRLLMYYLRYWKLFWYPHYKVHFAKGLSKNVYQWNNNFEDIYYNVSIKRYIIQKPVNVKWIIRKSLKVEGGNIYIIRWFRYMLKEFRMICTLYISWFHTNLVSKTKQNIRQLNSFDSKFWKLSTVVHL